jgi:WhiB family redox-sensing transcriptional regulator
MVNYTGVIISNALPAKRAESERGDIEMPQQSSAAKDYGTSEPADVNRHGSGSSYTPSAPENWFVDPIRLGVPGVRQPVAPGQPDDNPLAWQSDSLCAQTDPEAFFPEKGGSTRDAKKICASCEVRVHCLEYALENDERFGIWGGLSERERRKLRKRA